jgi:hypothetical protein
MAQFDFLLNAPDVAKACVKFGRKLMRLFTWPAEQN